MNMGDAIRDAKNKLNPILDDLEFTFRRPIKGDDLELEALLVFWEAIGEKANERKAAIRTLMEVHK